ncbi:MAG: putative lipid II flippase FtsW [Methylobacter sp.]|nr:MAG: putative lipid II flippase FtsW [Methylobacter sp.]
MSSVVENPIRIVKNKAFPIDPLLLFACVGLLLMGFVMMASSSLHLGVKLAEKQWFFYPLRQMLHIGLGTVLGAGVCKLPIKFWEKWGVPLFIGGLLLLVVVLIPGLGVKVNGSVRWLAVAGVRIQVSEVVKFLTVVYMAGYINRHQKALRESAFGIFKPLVLFAVASLLLLLEPDFGSAVVIMCIVMGILFLAGARLSQFIILLVLLTVAAVILVYLSQYRSARVTSFLNPWGDPQRTGFQLIQALISLGSGEWFGVGLGNGVQKLFYLPEAHTDFLFSVIGEELGFFGITAVIALFALFVWRAFVIAMEAERVGQRFSAFTAYGLAIWFGFQAFVHMGVNMGMLPTKGLTLPLMSYGGGSMMVMCCAVALLFRVNYELHEQKAGNPKIKGRTQWSSAL